MLAKLDGHLARLSARAAEAALASWGGPRAAVTHILYSSSSRNSAPGLEVELIAKLGLQVSHVICCWRALSPPGDHIYSWG